MPQSCCTIYEISTLCVVRMLVTYSTTKVSVYVNSALIFANADILTKNCSHLGGTNSLCMVFGRKCLVEIPRLEF